MLAEVVTRGKDLSERCYAEDHPAEILGNLKKLKFQDFEVELKMFCEKSSNESDKIQQTLENIFVFLVKISKKFSFNSQQLHSVNPIAIGLTQSQEGRKTFSPTIWKWFYLVSNTCN